MIEKLCMVIIFVGAAVGVGIYCRRTTGSVDGFVLGGRNVGPWMSAFAFGTSYFSAVIFVGYAEQFGWKYGIAATWIGIGNAILGSLLAWWVLGPRTREVTHRLGASTMPEFFGARYRSKGLRIAAAAIIFVFLIPYTASVYNGLSRLFGMAFGLPYEWCVIGMAVITCIYVVLGGYMATVMNDFIQGIVMLLGIVAVIVAVLVNNGGFTEAITSLSLIPAEGSEMAGPFVSFFGPNLPDLIGVVILTSLGTWGLPQMVHKFYSIRDEKSIKTGTIISTLFALVVAGGSYFNGAFGRLFVESPESVGGYDGIVPAMLGGQLNDLLMGIVIVLVLSASMSTLSSLVITSSSTLTLDLVRDQFRPQMAESRQVLILRVLCAAFIALSVVIAAIPNSLISSLMSLSWGALGGAFLAPFLYGLFWKGGTRAGVWASFAVGVGYTSLNSVFGWIAPTTAGAVAMLASMVVFPLVSLATNKLPQGEVKQIFSCYDEPVTVHQSVALEEARDD